jgi:hypothetical protein
MPYLSATTTTQILVPDTPVAIEVSPAIGPAPAVGIDWKYTGSGKKIRIQHQAYTNAWEAPDGFLPWSSANFCDEVEGMSGHLFRATGIGRSFDYHFLLVEVDGRGTFEAMLHFDT